MLKKRLIPVVLMRQGVAVQSKSFARYQRLGNPTTIVQRLSEWASDELVYLDISREQTYDLGRDDLKDSNRSTAIEILRDISRNCFMPLAFGGGIRTVDDIVLRVQHGADKVVVNTQPLREPAFINRAAAVVGSQCVVVCVDVRRRSPAQWGVFTDGGRTDTGRELREWLLEVQDRGAGEVLVQSIDQDGSAQGYDLPLIESARAVCRVPLIALGGVGEWAHFADAIRAGADAVAAANIFNYMENSVFLAKQHLCESGLNFRAARLGYQL